MYYFIFVGSQWEIPRFLYWRENLEKLKIQANIMLEVGVKAWSTPPSDE